MMPRTLTASLIALLIIVAGVLYTCNQPKIYQASGLIQIAQYEKQTNQLVCGNPLTTAIKVMQSSHIADQVIKQLNHNDQRLLIQPDTDLTQIENLQKILAKHSEFLPIWQTEETLTTYGIRCSYRNANPELATSICNAYMQAGIGYYHTTQMDSSMKAVEDLRIRIEFQDSRIKELVLAYQKLEQESATLPALGTSEHLTALEREIEVQKYFSTALQQRLDEEIARIDLGPSSALRIIDQAVISESPVNPNQRLQLSLSLLAGIGGGVFFFALGKRGHFPKQ